MSELILIGKSRKTGKWELLCDPSEKFDAHYRRWQKIAQSAPVNDEYSHVRFGRVQNTHSPMTLVTAAENKFRQESLTATNQKAMELSKSAAERQKKLDETEAAKAQKSHNVIIEEKTKQINEIRKVSGLEPAEVPKPKKLEPVASGQAAVNEPEKEEEPEEMPETGNKKKKSNGNGSASGQAAVDALNK